MAPPCFPDHVDGVGFAGGAGGHVFGKKDTAIDFKREGVQVEDSDWFISLGLFEQPLNLGIPFDGPALAWIAELAREPCPAGPLRLRAASLE